MTNLPSGTVAFLMSDIEGSTRLVAAAGDGFPALLDEHFSIMRGAIEAESGTIVSTEGDSVFAVLPAARSAVNAAIAAQRGLSSHQWPAGMDVRVRMGIHVGEAVFGGRDYTGLDVHRAARIMAAAWGGEIIVSQAVQALVSDMPEDRVTLRDMGVHSLRDIPDPERLYQVIAPGLRADFPPPRTESAAARTNLPVPLTRFVGRAREIAEVERLISEARLVTLTGPGGTGKTRLAIEVGRVSLGAFPDGVFFVALDTVRDPVLVLPQIAQTLGLIDEATRPIAETLAGYLSGKRLLLILDNLEQVIDVASSIAGLVGAAPEFVVLGSSREPLGVGGENVYPVSTLSLPSEPGHPSAAQVADLESVQLFVDRARAVRPDFALTDENAPAVAAICRRVDGLPLAIELAAARVSVLSPSQILDRLDHRLTLLAGSRRDVTDRQRTLRGAIDWSHELLSDDEKAAFRRFAVFAGGADLGAVLGVLDPDSSLGGDPIDLLAALASRNLLRSSIDGPEARFEMLETIREYALEQLATSGEEPKIRDRHADLYAGLAKQSENVLQAPDRDHKLDRLDRDMPNFSAALEWLIAEGDYERAAVIAVGLKDFWRTRSHFAESRRLLERLLEASSALGPTRAYADILGVAGELAAWQGDYEQARALSGAQIATLEALGDRPGLALAWSTVGWGNVSTQPDVAHRAFEQAVGIAREVDDLRVLQGALQGNAIALYRLGESDLARSTALEAYDVGRAMGDEYTNVFNVMTVGLIDLRTGHRKNAAERFAVALRTSEAAGANVGIIVALDAIAMAALDGGDVAIAATLTVAAERIRREVGGAPTMALVGQEPMVERLRAADPELLANAERAAPDLSTEEAIALAKSVAAAIAESG